MGMPSGSGKKFEEDETMNTVHAFSQRKKYENKNRFMRQRPEKWMAGEHRLMRIVNRMIAQLDAIKLNTHTKKMSLNNDCSCDVSSNETCVTTANRTAHESTVSLHYTQ